MFAVNQCYDAAGGFRRAAVVLACLPETAHVALYIAWDALVCAVGWVC